MSLINKMNVGNTNYDIQDRLMPDAIGQAGQVLKVKDDGSCLEFSTIESGGGKLYLHSMRFMGDSSSSGIFYGYLITNSEVSVKFTIETLSAYLTKLYNSEMIVYKNFTLSGSTSVGIFYNNIVYVMAGIDFEGNGTSSGIIDITEFTDTVTEL